MKKNILIVRLNALGDIVLTTGVLQTLKRAHPDVVIDFLCYQTHSSIIKELAPFVDNTFSLPKKLTLQTLKANPLNQKYDYIFDLQATLKSKRLCHFLNGSKIIRHKKHSFTRRLFTYTRLGKNKLQDHVCTRYAQTIFPTFNLPIPSFENLRPALSAKTLPELKTILPNPKPYVLIHPFASQKNKIWPYFDQLALQLLKQNLTLVFIGRGSLKELFPSLPLEKIIDLTNKTSLIEMCSLIQHCTGFFTNDSGPLHIATALKTPTVVIFGPTVREYGFFPEFDGISIVENNSLDCRPCHVHGGNTCPKKHFKCMKDLSPQEVIKQANFL